MCYQVTTHSLRCDVRPLISDGARDIVSGYSDPLPCHCPPNPAVARWLRCLDHGCCRTITRLRRCNDTKPCPHPTPFHFYEQVTRASTTPWPDLPILDNAFHATPSPNSSDSPVWRAALLELVGAGEKIKVAQALMLASRYKIRAMGRRHWRQHGRCNGCPWARTIANLREKEYESALKLPDMISGFKSSAWLVGRGEVGGGRVVSGLAVSKSVRFSSPVSN